MSAKAATHTSAITHRIHTSFSVRHARLMLRAIRLTRPLAGAPAIAKPYNPIEVWRLYRDIRTRKPRHVVELDCGYSTIAILQGLYRNGRGHLVSYEANETWMNAWNARIPDRLLPLVTFSLCSLERVEIGHRYCADAPLAIDYLFVDGPSPRDVPGWSGQPLALDPVLWQDRFLRDSRITVEGREENVELISNGLNRPITMKRHPPLRWTTFDLE